MSLRVKVYDLKRAVKYYSLYRGARYIDARYSESSLYDQNFLKKCAPAVRPLTNNTAYVVQNTVIKNTALSIT
jgi:hypothetical protein